MKDPSFWSLVHYYQPQLGQTHEGGRPKRVPPSRNRRRSRGKGKQRLPKSIANGSDLPVTNDRKSVQQVKTTFQISRYYLVLCSNQGIPLLCEQLFRSMQSYDYRMTENMTVEQLKYCTAMALSARCAQLAVECGYLRSNLPELFQLLQVVRNLQLPAVLASYIECVGKLQLASGVWIAPWFASRDQMDNRNLNVINVDDLLRQAGRPIPPNYWSIDSDWIATWNMATTRPSRVAMRFRSINWSNLAGTPEMVVTPIISSNSSNDVSYQPTAPQILTDDEFELGSVYLWRSYNELQFWPADTSLVCTRRCVFDRGEVWPNLIWSSKIVKDFTTST